MASVAQLVRAPDCDSGGRRFDPGHSPHLFLFCNIMPPLFEELRFENFLRPSPSSHLLNKLN